MMMVHHTGMCPADIDAAIRFYRDGIGLSELADFTMEADLEALLGRRTRSVRSVFLGSPSSPQGGTLELLDFGEPGFPEEPPGPGIPHRGLFLLSFQVHLDEVLDRLASLGLGGEPRKMSGPDGKVIAATVVDPDGVTVELLGGPVAQLPPG